MHKEKSAASSIPPALIRFRSLHSHRSRRDNTGLFVVEGIRQFIQACDANYEFDTVLVSPILLRHSLAEKLARRLCTAGVNKTALTPEQFRRFSTTQHASGIMAIVRQRWATLENVDPHRGLGWLIVEHLRSAGNLGTILRTAEAISMSGVVFIGGACDPYDPAVVRASMGGLFHLPIVRTRPRELSFWLATHHIGAIGLSPHTSRIWTDFPQAGSLALLLGNEREGLSLRLRRLCDHEVRLPMTGKADSLNVSIAAGIMMYELVRRRAQNG
jgi:TrmH family RNA methyltransferase